MTKFTYGVYLGLFLGLFSSIVVYYFLPDLFPIYPNILSIFFFLSLLFALLRFIYKKVKQKAIRNDSFLCTYYSFSSSTNCCAKSFMLPLIWSSERDAVGVSVAADSVVDSVASEASSVSSSRSTIANELTIAS